MTQRATKWRASVSISGRQLCLTKLITGQWRRAHTKGLRPEGPLKTALILMYRLTLLRYLRESCGWCSRDNTRGGPQLGVSRCAVCTALLLCDRDPTLMLSDLCGLHKVHRSWSFAISVLWSVVRLGFCQAEVGNLFNYQAVSGCQECTPGQKKQGFHRRLL